MIGDAARSTGATACLELNSIEEGTILWLLLSLFLLHFILFGFGGCSTWSNDDPRTVIWRGIRILIISNITIVFAVIVVAVAPSTETNRMQEEVVVSTPPGRMLELESLFVVSYWSCCFIIIMSTPTPSIEDTRRK